MRVRSNVSGRSIGFWAVLGGVACLAWANFASTGNAAEPYDDDTTTDKVAPATEAGPPDATPRISRVHVPLATTAVKAEAALVGIGAALTDSEGHTEIHEIIPGGAAALDGRLKNGDQILGVGQGANGNFEDTSEMRISDVANLVRGELGTVVRLKVRPVDDPKQTVIYEITRATVSIPTTPVTAVAAKAEAEPETPEMTEEMKALAMPTHHQTATIQANVKNHPATKLTCFALTPEGQILAGCNGTSGEIRVFDNEGNYVETWSLPIKPEAMYVRADGSVFIAGAGQLVKLDARGNIVKQTAAPHAESLKVNSDDLRKEVVNRAKHTVERMAAQGKLYNTVIMETEMKIEQLRKQMAANEKDSEETEEAPAASEAMIEQRIAAMEKRIEQYKQVKAQWETMQETRQPAELTEEQIEQQVQAAIQYKIAASSISATEDNVFLATRAAVGYGFEVWQTNADFEEGKTIIKGLSGCCGQMDVKVNDHGVFVAENSKHRVGRYDREGKLVGSWGHGDRASLEGFGSCCNPMNVAFGPEDVVYTAEDNTGRIKRYSPDGKLLGLVGMVDLVPGCKNCSIAVGPGGDQVYMLDITRDHIVRMDRYAPGESPGPAAVTTSTGGGGTLNVTLLEEPKPANGGQIMVRVLTSLFRLRAARPEAEKAKEAQPAEEAQAESNE